MEVAYSNFTSLVLVALSEIHLEPRSAGGGTNGTQERAPLLMRI